MREDAAEDRDRRRSPRVPRKSVVVHRTMQFPEPPGSSGRLRDVSPTGVRFESERDYPAGELLKLELTLPGWEKEKIDFCKADPREDLKPLVALAEVRWVKPLGNGLFEIGATFVNIDEWHGKALQAYVDRIEEEGKKRPGRKPFAGP
jgi:hypothetical protein